VIGGKTNEAKMRASNLKLSESQSIEDQIAVFFASGKTIEQVPINVYQHEKLSQTNVRTLLETSVAKLSPEQRKPHGGALRAKDRQSWALKELKK
jgi:hypothetical protein